MKNCCLCLNVTFEKKALNLDEVQECGSTISDLLKIHFWFSAKIFDKIKETNQSVICRTCWTKLENFHEFFCAVKFNYQISDDNIVTESLDEDFEKSWKKTLVDDQKPSETEIIKHKVESCIVENDDFDENQEVYVKCEMIDDDDDQKFGIDDQDDFSDSQSTSTLESSRKSSRIRFPTAQIEIPKVKTKKEPKERKHPIALSEEDDIYLQQFADSKCEICSTEIFGFFNAREHYRKAHKVPGYIRCCGRKMERTCEVVDHASWHQNPKIFSCRECGKAMLSRDNLAVHEATHVPPELRQFACDQCPKKFGAAITLLLHKRVHRVQKMKATIPCEHCGKLFKTKANLDVHRNSVHNTDGPFMCEFCSKVMKNKHSLEVHVRSHTDNEPEQCNICGHTLKNKLRLLAHMKGHKEEENGPYPCEKCREIGVSKEFAKLRSLKAHIHLVHSANRFKCETCGKEFKNKHRHEEHLAQHTGIEKYQCQFCLRTFKSNANMYSHRKKMHPEEHALQPPPKYLQPGGSGRNDE